MGIQHNLSSDINLNINLLPPNPLYHLHAPTLKHDLPNHPPTSNRINNLRSPTPRDPNNRCPPNLPSRLPNRLRCPSPTTSKLHHLRSPTRKHTDQHPRRTKRQLHRPSSHLHRRRFRQLCIRKLGCCGIGPCLFHLIRPSSLSPLISLMSQKTDEDGFSFFSTSISASQHIDGVNFNLRFLRKSLLYVNSRYDTNNISMIGRYVTIHDTHLYTPTTSPHLSNSGPSRGNGRRRRKKVHFYHQSSYPGIPSHLILFRNGMERSG